MKGLDVVYKGSCTSLVTVIQPLQKDEQLNSASTPLMSVFNTELPFCQEECSEKISLSLSQSVDSSTVIQSESERVITLADQPLDIAVILPELPDNSGYIKYRCSDQYISSIHPPYTETVVSNTYVEENYDEFSLCSQ